MTDKKTHWTQTPEGRKRMSEIQKLSHKNMKEVKKEVKEKKRKYTRKSITITITGPEASKAVSELISNVQYDSLNVSITIERN